MTHGIAQRIHITQRMGLAYGIGCLCVIDCMIVAPHCHFAGMDSCYAKALRFPRRVVLMHDGLTPYRPAIRASGALVARISATSLSDRIRLRLPRDRV